MGRCIQVAIGTTYVFKTQKCQAIFGTRKNVNQLNKVSKQNRNVNVYYRSFHFHN